MVESILHVDRIEKPGGAPVELTGQSAAKAWANLNPLNSLLRDSFNVSSFTDNGTGDQTFNLTNAMVNGNYSCSTGHQSQSYNFGYNAPSCWIYEYTTLAVPTRTSYTADSGGAARYDALTVNISIHGDLA